MVLNSKNLDNWGIGSAADYCKQYLPCTNYFLSTNNYTPDLSGNALHARIMGDLIQKKCKDGSNALYFDGTGNYLQSSDSSFATGTSQMTVCFWWYEPSGTPNYPTPISLSTEGTYQTEHLAIEGRNSTASCLLKTANGGYNTITFDRIQNAWNFWAVSRNTSGVYTLYYNCISKGTRTDTTSESGTYLLWGGNPSYKITGMLRDCMYFNGIALTLPQLKAIYNATYIE